MTDLSDLRGLTPGEAERSREVYGANVLPKQGVHGFLPCLAAGFSDPIIRILLVALCVNVIMTFNGAGWMEPVGIAVAVLLATTVSTLSEYSSETAFQRMQAEAAATETRVIRGGKVCKIPTSQVVVGDLVLLSAGEKIPADGVVTQGELRVDQSSLNGESKEVRKCPGNTADGGLNAREKLFCGSFAVSGEAVMTVTRVGQGTIYGEMALETGQETRESPLRCRLGHLAGTLTKLGLTAAALVAVADLFRAFVLANDFDPPRILASLTDLNILTTRLVHALLLTVTMVVVAVPEGLPMMVTVVLSSNMVRMMKNGVLVRKPVGIETAGSMDLLFTDKTGTLTGGRPALVGVITGLGEKTEPGQLHKDPALRELLCLSAVYNSGCRLSEGKAVGGDGTERALLNGVLPLPAGLPKHRVTEKLPFHSTRKLSAATLEDGRTLVKGAPEKILPACRRILKNGRELPVSLSALEGEFHRASAQGLRVVAVAYGHTPVTEEIPPKDLTFVALCLLRDTLRPTTRGAVDTLHQAGIQVVMLTGDSLDTAVTVGKEAGITRDGEGAYEASVLRAMSDGELSRLLPDIRIIARSLPTDKSRLVKIAQEAGRVVGMTGDGVNDAPALKRADVGFAMGSGSDVAKEAGDIVLQNDDMASITRAVLYGRTVFHSIRKFLVYQLTMNLCAVGVSVLGPLIGVDTPITVIQMLWINLIMDTLAGLAFAGEPPLMSYMKETPKPRDARILTRSMLGSILRMGAFTLTLSALFLCLPSVRARFVSETAFLGGFFTLFILSGLSNAFNARTSGMRLLRGLKDNRTFVAIVASSTAIQLFLLRFGGTVFRTVPLPVQTVLWIAALSTSVIPADLCCKAVGRVIKERKRRPKGKTAEKSVQIKKST